MASGMTTEYLINDYPDLQSEDLMARVEHVATLIQVRSIYRIAS